MKTLSEIVKINLFSYVHISFRIITAVLIASLVVVFTIDLDKDVVTNDNCYAVLGLHIMVCFIVFEFVHGMTLRFDQSVARLLKLLRGLTIQIVMGVFVPVLLFVLFILLWGAYADEKKVVEAFDFSVYMLIVFLFSLLVNVCYIIQI